MIKKLLISKNNISAPLAGFTLIEILMVIAIIGILAGRQIINLNSARIKARVANVESSLSSLVPMAVLCHDNGQDLMDGGSPAVYCNNSVWTPEGEFCGVENNWPALRYGTPGTCTSNTTTQTFSFSATVDSATITCTESGCIKSP